MKRILFLSLSLLLFSINLCMAGDSSTSMTPIIDKADNLVSYIEQDLDMEIVRMEFDILRSTKTTIRTLSAGWNYAIIAFGDFRFSDIDVKVYRKVGGNWQIVEKDADTSAVAVVAINPPSDGEYLIEIKAYSFESGYDVGHYGLIIAHE